jgi:hypothetical protein
MINSHIASLLLLLPLAAVHADSGWEKKTIGDLRIEVPAGSENSVQNIPGAGGCAENGESLVSHSRA